MNSFVSVRRRSPASSSCPQRSPARDDIDSAPATQFASVARQRDHLREQYSRDNPRCDRENYPSSRQVVSSGHLRELAGERAIESVGLVPCDASSSWWIGRVLTLAPEQRTAWVVAQCLDEYKNEEVYAQACQKETFQQRMTDAGLGSLLGADPPRKKIRTLLAGGSHSLHLLDENAQRLIAKSLATYASGIRCWGAFCDAANITSISQRRSGMF